MITYRLLWSTERHEAQWAGAPVPHGWRRAMPLIPPEKWVAAENIARFKEQLKIETDDNRRKMLQKLLAAEEAKIPRRSRF